MYAKYYINTKQTILLVDWILVVHIQHKNDDRLFVKLWTAEGPSLYWMIERKQNTKILSVAICHSSLFSEIPHHWLMGFSCALHLYKMIDKINDYYIIYT